MDNETQKKIDEKMATLPSDIKNAISSPEVAAKLTEISKKHGLLIDQSNDLYLEISLAMIGLEPLSDFLENVIKNVGLKREKAEMLCADINKEIFLPVRESLMKLNTDEKNSEVTQTSYPDLSKEDIMAEIENPTPAVHPISIVDQTIPGPAKPREIVTQNFIAGKLTENVNLASQKVNVAPEKPAVKPPEKPKYAADPYREPIS